MFGCNANQDAKKEASQTENQATETTQSQKKTEITETSWKLVSLHGEQVPMHEDQREAHIILKPEGNKVTGSGGCNVLNGTYELGDGSSILFSKMATTMMSCPDMETEQQFLKVFEKAETYRVKGDTLLLNNSNENTLAKLVSAPAKKN
jgi:heat shock protein HslJ